MKQVIFIYLIISTLVAFSQEKKASIYIQKTSHIEQSYNIIHLYDDSTFYLNHDEVCYQGSEGYGTYKQYSKDSIILTFPTVHNYSFGRLDSTINQDKFMTFEFNVMTLDSSKLTVFNAGLWYKNQTWKYTDSTTKTISIKNKHLQKIEDWEIEDFNDSHIISVGSKNYYFYKLNHVFNPEYDYQLTIFLSKQPEIYHEKQRKSMFPWLTNLVLKGVIDRSAGIMVLEDLEYEIR